MHSCASCRKPPKRENAKTDSRKSAGQRQVPSSPSAYLLVGSEYPRGPALPPSSGTSQESGRTYVPRPRTVTTRP